MLSSKILLSIENNPTFVQTIKLDVLKKAILEADDKYYNYEEPIMSDDVYDHIRNYIIEQDPSFSNNKQSEDIEVKDGDKVKLPVHMGSMSKHGKSDKDEKFVDTDVVISDKLDGVSCLVDKRSGKYIKLYTKGNSKYGMDISYLLKYINGIDTRLDVENRCMVRGELIMKIETFNKLQTDESNARNTVAGIVKSKTPKEKYNKKVDFVAYEMIDLNKQMTPNDQFQYLKNSQFNVVNNEHFDNVDKNRLSETLQKRKRDSVYEIDGIIVAKNIKYTLKTKGDPDHAYAYKENDITLRVQTKVKYVEWNISKDRFLKPRVFVEHRFIKNVKVTKATGFNAKYIFDNKIGAGTELILERSGEVIPHIVSIVKSTEADMPDVKYQWTKSGVDIYVSDDDESQKQTIDLKVFKNMLQKLEFEHLGETTSKILFNSNIRTIRDLYDMTLEDIRKLEGFQDKKARNLYDSIQLRKNTITCLDYMVASNSFGKGFGESKLQTIISKFHPINDKTEPTLLELESIDGIGKVTAKNYLEGLKLFKQFIKLNKLDSVCEEKMKEEVKKEEVKKESNKFHNKVVLFTGFRDKELEEYIVKNGGVVKSTMSNQINLIIYKSVNKKVETAIEKGIETIRLEDYKKSFV